MRRLCRGSSVADIACLGARLVPVALAVALAGCANSTGTRVYGHQTVAQQSKPVDLEEDGLPAQVAPRAGIRNLPDDPSEPFSPNYGSPQRLRSVAVPVSLSVAEADALVAHAIAAHEMRRP